MNRTTTPLAGDPAVQVLSYSYNDDRHEFRAVFVSDVRRSVTIASPPGQDGQGAVRQMMVRPDERTVVKMQSPNGEVWVSTAVSVDNGVYTLLDATGNSLIPEGPYDGADVRNAALGEFLALGSMMLYKAVQARRGAHSTGERLA